MTKLSELPDEELSRWIAEKMEPLDRKRFQCHAAKTDCIREFHDDSPKEWWRRDREQSYDESYMKPDAPWQPRSINEPEICLRLLKHPGFVSLNLLLPEAKYEACFCGETEHHDECGAKMETTLNTRFERAIAEAFALANGWKP